MYHIYTMYVESKVTKYLIKDLSINKEIALDLLYLDLNSSDKMTIIWLWHF